MWLYRICLILLMVASTENKKLHGHKTDNNEINGKRFLHNQTNKGAIAVLEFHKVQNQNTSVGAYSFSRNMDILYHNGGSLSSKIDTASSGSSLSHTGNVSVVSNISSNTIASVDSSLSRKLSALGSSTPGRSIVLGSLLSVKTTQFGSSPLEGNNANDVFSLNGSAISSGNHLFRRSTSFVAHSVSEDTVFSVAKLAWEALAQNNTSCHYVFVTNGIQQPLASHIVRYSSVVLKPLLLIDLEDLQESTDQLLKADVWDKKSAICRGILVDCTSGDNEIIFDFLEASKVWLWPDARVVIVGLASRVTATIHHAALRNTLQPLYLGLQDLEPLNQRTLKIHLKRTQNSLHQTLGGEDMEEENDQTIFVYGRCLYCGDGKAKVKFLAFWPLGISFNQSYSDPFPNQVSNLHWTFLRVVSMALFPYSAYSKDTDKPATTVSLHDSIDARILSTLASHLSFRYEVRAPWDGQWGIPTESGNWTGLLGTIQYDKADFTTIMSTNPSRNTIIDHERIYVADVMAVVSLKPQILPPYLLIIRPFTVEVWIWLISCIMFWGICLWVLDKVRSAFTDEDGIMVTDALFYGWSVILEDPPKKQLTHTTGQMLLGWWLVGCLVITTGFKASLVAFFTVQSKTPPIDNFEDMVNRNNWKWGIERAMMTGGPLSYFKSSTDPVVKTVYQYVEPIEEKDGLAKVLRGGYSFLDLRNDIATNIASYYTDRSGRTPYYISKYGHKMLSDFGWGYRKGSPFRQSFSSAINHLIESGIIDQWKREVMTSRVRDKRKEKEANEQNNVDLKQQLIQDTEDQSGFRMSHMMSLLLLLAVGFTLASLSLIGELILGRRRSSK